jgi:hypothetical protein
MEMQNDILQLLDLLLARQEEAAARQEKRNAELKAAYAEMEARAEARQEKADARAEARQTEMLALFRGSTTCHTETISCPEEMKDAIKMEINPEETQAAVGC